MPVSSTQPRRLVISYPFVSFIFLSSITRLAECFSCSILRRRLGGLVDFLSCGLMSLLEAASLFYADYSVVCCWWLWKQFSVDSTSILEHRLFRNRIFIEVLGFPNGTKCYQQNHEKTGQSLTEQEAYNII